MIVTKKDLTMRIIKNSKNDSLISTFKITNFLETLWQISLTN